MQDVDSTPTRPIPTPDMRLEAAVHEMITPVRGAAMSAGDDRVEGLELINSPIMTSVLCQSHAHV
jgi:hypothetical protein